MHFFIDHQTRYDYDRPVTLGPQFLRLRPRPDGGVLERDYRLLVEPRPARRSEHLDAAGNRVTRLEFADPVTSLTITSQCEVQICRDDPWDFLPPGESLPLPVRYEERTAAILAPYLRSAAAGPRVAALGRELRAAAGDDLRVLLETLTRRLHADIGYEVRETGAPLAADETLERGRGACRDLTLLFMAVCRTAGLAARFVSGYQARSAHGGTRRYLHAWPEVYLPGGGWRGFDPSHGTAVGDAHVPVAAALDPRDAAPLEGAFYGSGAVNSRLSFELSIRVGDAAAG
jgi:transglutaminase-like putative cysteine protease